MTDARSDVLARIRQGLAGAPTPPPALERSAGRPVADAVSLFVQRVGDYGAAVVVTDAAGEAVAATLARHHVRTLGTPPDLPGYLAPAGVEVVVDQRLSPVELDGLDGALTTCAWACAETGTIALTGGPGEGRRALSLVPDLHVCVVRSGQVVGTVPELLARLAPAACAGRPIVLVSGPSATSDIGLTRVEGVHGPRRLEVVVDVGG